ncbi:MAG: NAD-dependent epimerase/dehydratase family protein [Rhodospirillales bacterium]|nr:NAD-dependent epimerase/dehydratase family protein [Rhodospirillales bacterium]MDE2574085.1 NAD-dependent epimerase/dehydratase family protein [Rhodospirillales bacterium]
MTILVTGAAGFIGHHVARALLARGERVIGVDNLNTYYDVRLKQARLDRLAGEAGFRFRALDVSDRAAMAGLAGEGIERIVHLAAQAGVRHSMVDPYSYVTSNLMGHLVVLELARHIKGLRHLVYASSSSVYGGGATPPFVETDRADAPFSLYAATKRADELMSHSYAHLYGIPQTGLRFFTVYGPWGRPDMAYFSFAEAIAEGRPITVYDEGRPRRDFTYVDDIVAGVLGCLDRPPEGTPPHRVLNIGNNRSETVLRLISLLEEGLERQAVIRHAPRPAGDVPQTMASIDAIAALCGFAPRTPLEQGIPAFVAWFKEWRVRRAAAAKDAAPAE